jgi:hypothetical protein
MALRGTVMSSPSLFGDKRAKEGDIERRAFQRFALSLSSFAREILVAPVLSQIFAMD